jgi:hypothetical protein
MIILRIIRINFNRQRKFNDGFTILKQRYFDLRETVVDLRVVWVYGASLCKVLSGEMGLG